MAEHYKRIASLVTDEDISKALLELAAKYEAMAKSLRIEPPARRGTLPAPTAWAKECPAHWGGALPFH